jgi:hypothetical protein
MGMGLVITASMQGQWESPPKNHNIPLSPNITHANLDKLGVAINGQT